jgi:hypothetical protein
MAPIHRQCGTATVPRWIIADDGDDAIVAWCPTCDRPPSADELEGAISVDDVSIAMINQSTKVTRVQ